MQADLIYERIEQRIAGWAGQREDVRAVIVVGSRARSDHPADRWSDLDTIVFVDDPEIYHQPDGWQADLCAALGLTVWLAVFDLTGMGDPEWDLVLEGGVKVDLVFTLNRSPRGSDASLAEMVDGFPYIGVLEDGMRPLLEKTPGPSVRLGQPPRQGLPGAAEYKALIDHFLLDVIRAVKIARRGELWRAAQIINNPLQAKILKLLVWQSAASSLTGGVPHYRGRFLEEWAAPHLVRLVQDTFADSTPGGIERSIGGALRFLSAVTDEIAQTAGLTYPSDAVEQIDQFRSQLPKSWKKKNDLS